MDGDGIPDHHDDDIDQDGIPNHIDDDIDGDGIPNDHDIDRDGDGFHNHQDDSDGEADDKKRSVHKLLRVRIDIGKIMLLSPTTNHLQHSVLCYIHCLQKRILCPRNVLHTTIYNICQRKLFTTQCYHIRSE